jgi:hypothetical protein
MSAVLFALAIVAAVTSLVAAVAPREAPVTLPLAAFAALAQGVAAAVAAVTPLVAAVSIPVAPVT